MALKSLVKVGSVTNLTDARYCAGMGVDLLGFLVVEGADNFITARAFQEIRGWVTGPQIVAELYGIQDLDQLKAITEQYRPDYFEVGPEELEKVGNNLTLPFILKLSYEGSVPTGALEPAYIITPVHALHLEKILPDYEVLFAVSNVDEMHDALKKTGIAGVALNGGSEIKPGLKNFDDLSEILEALETDD